MLLINLLLHDLMTATGVSYIIFLPYCWTCVCVNQSHYLVCWFFSFLFSHDVCYENLLINQSTPYCSTRPTSAGRCPAACSATGEPAIEPARWCWQLALKKVQGLPPPRIYGYDRFEGRRGPDLWSEMIFRVVNCIDAEKVTPAAFILRGEARVQ